MYKRNDEFATLTPECIYPTITTDLVLGQSELFVEKALIFCTLLYNRWWDIRKDEGNVFQKISTDFLIALLTRDYYKVIINRLVELNIVECHKSYMTGVFSMGYRLSDEVLHEHPIARKLKYTESKTRLKKIDKYIREKVLKFYPYLKPQFDNMKLIHIDFPEAEKWIKNNKSLSEHKKDYYLDRAKRVNCGISSYLSVGSHNKRVFTQFTNLPSKLRPFLYLEDNKSNFNRSKVIIDGTNTQPALICIKMKRDGFDPEYDYFDACMRGKIYDFIADDMRINVMNSPIVNKIDRNWVKARFLDTLLFTKQNGLHTHRLNNLNERNEEKKAFSIYFMNRFPKVWGYLLTTKISYSKLIDGRSDSRISKKKKRNIGGSKLAIEIQQMESQFWIHSLLPEIPSDYIYVTIHDAVMLFNPTREKVEYLYKIIKDLSVKIFGVELPIHIEEVKNPTIN